MRSIACLALLAASLSACSSSPDAASSRTDDVVGGEETTAYPETVQISVSGRADCTGTLLAPRVVLTAGHCVVGQRSWYVSAPAVGLGARSHVVDTAVYDYRDGCNLDCEDVALLFLADPIQLDRYPTIAPKALADGTEIVSLGMMRDSRPGDGLYATEIGAIRDGAKLGIPSMYIREPGVLEHGDSGGPSFLPGSEHVLVGVNAAITRSPRRDFLNKLDRVASWISEQTKGAGGEAKTCSFQGKTLASGESVPNPASACNTCTCRGDGQVQCSDKSCDEPRGQGCMSDGKWIATGAKIEIDCNTCTCRAPVDQSPGSLGYLSCTPRFCL